MEAMRLSLVEHEEQQRREREAKAKEQATAEAGGGASNTGEAGAGSSSSMAAASSPAATATPGADGLTSTLTSPGLENTEPLPATANGDAERPARSRTGHGTSLSVDMSRAELDSSGTFKRRSSVSPYRVSAALRSAASTASALVSPNSEDSPSNSRTSEADVRDLEDTPRVAANIPLPPETVDNADTGVDSSPAASVPRNPTRMHHSDSFASSIDLDTLPTYDPLPSRPGSAASSFSHKPLLASPSIPDALSVNESANSSSQVLNTSHGL